MYTSSILGYTLGKVPRLLGHDNAHKEQSSRCAGTLDTTGHIYAANNDNCLSISLFLDRPLVTDVPTWGVLTGRSSTLT